MNPFPVSMELFLYAAAGVVAAIYVFRAFLPAVRRMLGSDESPEDRAAELLERYREEKSRQTGRNGRPAGD